MSFARPENAQIELKKLGQTQKESKNAYINSGVSFKSSFSKTNPSPKKSKEFEIKSPSKNIKNRRKKSIHHFRPKRLSKTPSYSLMTRTTSNVQQPTSSTTDTKFLSTSSIKFNDRSSYSNKGAPSSIKRIQTVEPDFMSSALAESFKKHRMKAKQSFSKSNNMKQLNMFFKKSKRKSKRKKH